MGVRCESILSTRRDHGWHVVQYRAKLYVDGIAEARRILKKSGLLWVKNQDETHNGRQYWRHVDILNAAVRLGFTGEDLFVLVSGKPAHMTKQRHARKNHSYLWVLRFG